MKTLLFILVFVILITSCYASWKRLPNGEWGYFTKGNRLSAYFTNNGNIVVRNDIVIGTYMSLDEDGLWLNAVNTIGIPDAGATSQMNFIIDDVSRVWIGSDWFGSVSDNAVILGYEVIPGALYYRWKNVYSYDGNFSDDVIIGDDCTTERYLNEGVISIDTTFSASNIAVGGGNVLQCDTSLGNIEIYGFTGGTSVQTLHLFNLKGTNDIKLYNQHASGSQKIYTNTGADILISGSGGATLVFDGTYWYVIGAAL